MEFDSARALRKATGRAKSDVANKLISMLLHEISRRACANAGLHVSDHDYLNSVTHAFGHRCIYCRRTLEHDRAAVEHLNGMNRFRIGLHIPGNVAMACRNCNREKRRDDQLVHLTLASTGWESFLSHDGRRCPDRCMTCAYWRTVWPEPLQRQSELENGIKSIRAFQSPYSRFIQWAAETQPAVQTRVEALYRSCQDFATCEIEKLTSELSFDFGPLIIGQAGEPKDSGANPQQRRTLRRIGKVPGK